MRHGTIPSLLLPFLFMQILLHSSQVSGAGLDHRFLIKKVCEGLRGFKGLNVERTFYSKSLSQEEVDRTQEEEGRARTIEKVALKFPLDIRIERQEGRSLTIISSKPGYYREIHEGKEILLKGEEAERERCLLFDLVFQNDSKSLDSYLTSCGVQTETVGTGRFYQRKGDNKFELLWIIGGIREDSSPSLQVEKGLFLPVIFRVDRIKVTDRGDRKDREVFEFLFFREKMKKISPYPDRVEVFRNGIEVGEYTIEKVVPLR